MCGSFLLLSRRPCLDRRCHDVVQLVVPKQILVSEDESRPGIQRSTRCNANLLSQLGLKLSFSAFHVPSTSLQEPSEESLEHVILGPVVCAAPRLLSIQLQPASSGSISCTVPRSLHMNWITKSMFSPRACRASQT